jgi:tetratricopeptide (TPR) repeat protein
MDEADGPPLERLGWVSRYHVTILEAFNLALQHQMAGRFADAEAIYRQILTQQPDHIDALYMMGVIAQQSGNDDTAMQFVAEAIRIGPVRAEFFGTYGELLEHCKRFDEAVEAYRNALALDNKLAVIHNNLGNILATKGDCETAIPHFEQALAIQPDLPIVAFNLGRAYACLGKLNEAMRHYRQAIALRPAFLEAMHCLGRVLALAESNDAAIVQYRETLVLASKMPAAEQKSPDHIRFVARVLCSLGDALGGNGLLDQSALCYEGAMKLAPDRFESFFNYSICLLNLQRYEDAVVACDIELKKQPDLPQLHYNRGCALIRIGRTEEARAAFVRATALMPPTGDRVNLAQELRRAKMFDEAVEALRGMVAKGNTSLDQSTYWELLETCLAKSQEAAKNNGESAPTPPKLPYLGDKVVLLHCDRAAREQLRTAGLHGGYAIDPQDGTEIWLSTQLATQPDAAKVAELVEQWLQWIRNEAAMAGTTATVWMPDMPQAVADTVRRLAGEDLIEITGDSADDIFAKLSARAVTPPDTEDKFFAVVSIRNGGLELLPHWLEHYTNLGVDQILLGVFDDLAGDSEAELEKCAARWKFRRFVQRWKAATESETYCQRQTGCRLAGARPGTWILHTDLDELQQYPAKLTEIAAAASQLKIRAIFGRFYDRIAADGSLPPILPQPSLWKQFPVECNMTDGILKSAPQKVMMARFSVLVKTGHHEAPLERTYPTPIGRVAHFKWHSGLLERMRWGLKQDNASPEWKGDARRFLGWLEKHGGRVNLGDPALGARLVT